MTLRDSPILEPMRVRPGAAYRCHGDGLCCTDIHGLGPLTKREVKRVRVLDPKGAGYDDDHEDDMLCTAADGGCRFLLPNQYCDIHASHGPELKPHGCQKFPYGLTATPAGGRVTTEHRCPCRTMGDRPPITVEGALTSLRPPVGRLDSDVDVVDVRLTGKRRVPFRRWEAMEEPILAALAAGVHPEVALGARPYPALRGTSWVAVAEGFIAARDGSRFGAALAWFGDTILQHELGQRPREPERPWAAAFDRAEARSPRARDPRDVLNDFVADQLFALKWAVDVGFERFGAEITTRASIAESIASRLAARGLRADRAMAEAVMVVELIGASEHWDTLVPRMKP